MSDNSIFYGLITLAVTLTLSYLSKVTNKGVLSDTQGQYLLRMHKLYYIVGIIALIFCAVFVASPLFVHNPDLPLYITIVCMLFLFGGLGLLSVLYYRRHYVLFDNTKLEVQSPLGSTKKLLWDDISKAKFNSFSGHLVLTSKTGDKAKIHYHLVGFPKFVEKLESKTTWTSKQMKLPVQEK